MEFSRQEYWSGLPFPSPGALPNPGIEPGSPALQADALPSEPPFNNRNILQTHSHNLHFKETGLARRFFPETVLKEDTLLLYNPKECRGGKNVCPFLLLENSRPLSPWGPPDFLSTWRGADSLTITLCSQRGWSAPA